MLGCVAWCGVLCCVALCKGSVMGRGGSIGGVRCKGRGIDWAASLLVFKHSVTIIIFALDIIVFNIS